MSTYDLYEKLGYNSCSGAFSSVYKAIDNAKNKEIIQRLKKGNICKAQDLEKRYRSMAMENDTIIALKRIYAISSLRRIYNEIRILHILRSYTTRFSNIPCIFAKRHKIFPSTAVEAAATYCQCSLY